MRKLRMTVALAAVTAGFAVLPSSAGAVSDEVKTTFDPKVQGYHFPNNFVGPLTVPLGSVNLPGSLPSVNLGSVNLGTNQFGLCGGMSYGAADHFNAKTPAPTTKDTPTAGSALYNYIYGRQVDSLNDHGKYGIKTLAFWMLLPLKDQREPIFGGRLLKGLKTRTKAEIKKARSTLSTGQVVPLLLVKTGVPSVNKIKEGLTKNHQVLGIGAFKADNGQSVVAIWDPNLQAGNEEYSGAPATDTEARDGITYLFAKSRKQFSDRAGTHQVTGIPAGFRGFFRTKYDVKTPVVP